MGANSRDVVTRAELQRATEKAALLAVDAVFGNMRTYLQAHFGLVPPPRTKSCVESEPASPGRSDGLRITSPERVRQLSLAAVDPVEAGLLKQRGFWSERNEDGSLAWYRRPPASGTVVHRDMASAVDPRG